MQKLFALLVLVAFVACALGQGWPYYRGGYYGTRGVSPYLSYSSGYYGGYGNGYGWNGGLYGGYGAGYGTWGWK
ncbi:hypothetical protein TNCV_2658691 [Trichonephila clavipes]|nr:hypothetical protein TNCV_2658691 [Trichonephila clavipes]